MTKQNNFTGGIFSISDNEIGRIIWLICNNGRKKCRYIGLGSDRVKLRNQFTCDCGNIVLTSEHLKILKNIQKIDEKNVNKRNMEYLLSIGFIWVKDELDIIEAHCKDLGKAVYVTEAYGYLSKFKRIEFIKNKLAFTGSHAGKTEEEFNCGLESLNINMSYYLWRQLYEKELEKEPKYNVKLEDAVYNQTLWINRIKFIG